MPYLHFPLASRVRVILVSLRNRTAERRGRQNARVWQTWLGYYLRVLSGILLTLMFCALLQKICLKKMHLHSAELNVVAVTENVNTFLLVWTHVSRYGVNWLYCCKVYKVLTVVMYSSQLSNYQLLFLYLTLFICWLIFYLKPPELVRPHRLGNTFPIISHWVFGRRRWIV